MDSTRIPVTIVCVFNDVGVFVECLQGSYESLLSTAPETELIGVDNTGNAFSSAGSALTHGAARARHDYIVLVHQDVALHSLRALERAARLLRDNDDIGVLGASGIDAGGILHGRMRDRVVLTGRVASDPVDVDSLDEVLFVARRKDLIAEPLSADPDLAWHAYAVEYGLRLRARGQRVAALDMPITHNSLTVNLDRLDEAHARVGERYPAMVPVRTTCGVIAPSVTTRPLSAWLRPHRWRYRWLRESLMAHRGSRASGLSLPVLGDIRLDVDDVLAGVGELVVLNVDDGWFGTADNGEVTLTRRGHTVHFRAAPLDSATALLRSWPSTRSILVTNLILPQLHRLSDAPDATPQQFGYATDLGYWLLRGPVAQYRSEAWDDPRSRPAFAAASAVSGAVDYAGERPRSAATR